MSLDRLISLRERLAAGELSIGEIDVAKELALIGFDACIRDAKYAEEMKLAATSGRHENLPANLLIQQVVWALNGHPELTDAVVELIAAKLSEKEPADGESSV